MRRFYIGCSFLGLSLLTACNPDPVDENADFTIYGVVQNTAGQPPAAGAKVHIYKVDSLWSKESNFLQYADLEEDLNANAVYQASTDSTGKFSITLKGSQVNTASGAGAAYLTVVYFDGGMETSLATASDWSYFTNANPNWDVGTLKLWDGGTATQSAGNITYTWATNRAPLGNVAATDLPSFLFVWDAGSTDALPKWAAHTFNPQVTVPRAAFKNAVGSPEFFITAFSKEGSRYFQHRTSLHSNAVANWTQAGEGINLVSGASDLFDGSPTTPFSSNAATDGQIETLYDFLGTETTDIFIDLGGNSNFSHVILYDLIVRNYGDALISVFGCTALEVGVGCGTQIGDTHQGDWNFYGEDAYVYLAISPVGGATAEWLRISVEPDSVDGNPYFDAVSEIRVMQ